MRVWRKMAPATFVNNILRCCTLRAKNTLDCAGLILLFSGVGGPVPNGCSSSSEKLTSSASDCFKRVVQPSSYTYGHRSETAPTSAFPTWEFPYLDQHFECFVISLGEYCPIEVICIKRATR
ncbi:hypothetical protein EJ06DRAFT_327701 [Trichodelitschia bisporula]|uniref:Uncharacterized protein n=1 Tax=Trichodelitschia bisporula TaxID=703511 RepID=A0A6G1I1I4_9PEZI|nr:hypothetical protein EJ06DRAFT_327701 [Trichodelitschia bisporula]